MFEAAIERAGQVGRVWLSDWAQAQLARVLSQVRPLDPASSAGIERGLQCLGAANLDWLEEPAQIAAEIALAQGRLDEAWGQVELACAEARESGCRPNWISASELRLRILLRLGRPGDVISLAEEGLRAAEEIGCRPMVWRIRAAKAQALWALGDADAAAREVDAAAAILHELAGTISDVGLRLDFLSSPLVSSIVAAPSSHSHGKE